MCVAEFVLEQYFSVTKKKNAIEGNEESYKENKRYTNTNKTILIQNGERERGRKKEGNIEES